MQDLERQLQIMEDQVGDCRRSSRSSSSSSSSLHCSINSINMSFITTMTVVLIAFCLQAPNTIAVVVKFLNIFIHSIVMYSQLGREMARSAQLEQEVVQARAQGLEHSNAKVGIGLPYCIPNTAVG